MDSKPLVTPEIFLESVALFNNIALSKHDVARAIKEKFPQQFGDASPRAILFHLESAFAARGEPAPSKENRDAVRDAAILRLYNEYGSAKAVSVELGLPRTTIRRVLDRDPDRKPVKSGTMTGYKDNRFPLPKRGTKRYLCTSAQNNTSINSPVWENLLALADHYDARILVSRFSYNKSGFQKKMVKPDTVSQEPEDSLWYDPAITPYLCDVRTQLAPGLVWCGEMNIIPTATRPLSGLDTYTGRASGIFPHVKCALVSVASHQNEDTKFNYTTGTITQKNYLKRKAGLKAEAYHEYGCLLVEITPDGSWFCRQVNAGIDNSLHDLGIRVHKGKVTEGNVLEAINWGDVHTAQISPMVEELAWGTNGMLDVLRPKKQLLHDLIDFRARNHHEIKNHHAMFERYISGRDSVEKEFEQVLRATNKMRRKFTELYVIDSNHDRAFERWLKDFDFRFDPVNAKFYLEAQQRYYQAIEEGDTKFLLAEWALHRIGGNFLKFIAEGESLIVTPGIDGGIECGLHGHLGLNGARGNPVSLAKMGRKVNAGHTHSAQIIDGVYVAGTSSKLDLGYNRGPSSWSHSHILTYANGKRAIVTMYKGRWRA